MAKRIIETKSAGRAKQFTPLARQQGSVLLIAVFITSVIVAIAARFTGDFQLSVARAEHTIIGAQLQQYSYSV
jgi:hypothetical protein